MLRSSVSLVVFAFLSCIHIGLINLIQKYNLFSVVTRSLRVHPEIQPIFLGYSLTQSAYLCYDQLSSKIFVSRHIDFVETEFPFCTFSLSPQPSHTVSSLVSSFPSVFFVPIIGTPFGGDGSFLSYCLDCNGLVLPRKQRSFALKVNTSLPYPTSPHTTIPNPKFLQLPNLKSPKI